MTGTKAGWLVPILAFVLGIHLWAAAVTIRHSNQDQTASDQGAEMWLSGGAREDWYPQRSDGVRHPLYSWAVSGLYSDDNAVFFERGKWANTILCLVFLSALGIVAARSLDPLALANLLMLCSLGILLVRGTYFQPEPLYYITFFVAAVCSWRILRAQTLPVWLYPVFGLSLALAFLSKPSLLPYLAVFCGALALRTLLSLRAEGMGFAKRWVGVVGAFALMALMVAPLGLFTKTHFGRAFFNYPQVWMWMDDFEKEAWPWQTKYPSGREMALLDKKDIPSASWYFARHTVGDAANRLWHGVTEVKTRFLYPEKKLSSRAFFWKKEVKNWQQPLAHRGTYLVILSALCLILAIFGWRKVAPLLVRPENLACAALVFGTFAVYLTLYGWYYPIGKGDRFMGSLWIPAVCLVFWAAVKLSTKSGTTGSRLYFGVHSALLLSLLLQSASLLWLFTHGVYLTTRN